VGQKDTTEYIVDRDLFDLFETQKVGVLNKESQFQPALEIVRMKSYEWGPYLYLASLEDGDIWQVRTKMQLQRTACTAGLHMLGCISVWLGISIQKAKSNIYPTNLKQELWQRT